MASLYTHYPKGRLHVLGDKDFAGAKMRPAAFAGPGILKAYAPWCPHCVDKVPQIKALAASLCEQPELGLHVYTVNAEAARAFAQAAEVSGFPTFFIVDAAGGLQKLDSVHSVEGCIEALCTKDSKRCPRKSALTQKAGGRY